MDETRVTKTVSFCPFQKLYPRRQFWFDPNALLHLLGGEALAPARPAGFRQIDEWTGFDFEGLKFLKYLPP